MACGGTTCCLFFFVSFCVYFQKKKRDGEQTHQRHGSLWCYFDARCPGHVHSDSIRSEQSAEPVSQHGRLTKLSRTHALEVLARPYTGQVRNLSASKRGELLVHSRSRSLLADGFMVLMKFNRPNGHVPLQQLEKRVLLLLLLRRRRWWRRWRRRWWRWWQQLRWRLAGLLMLRLLELLRGRAPTRRCVLLPWSERWLLVQCCLLLMILLWFRPWLFLLWVLNGLLLLWVLNWLLLPELLF